MLLGLNHVISQMIKKEFATHRVTKIYYALVRGVPKTPSGVWTDNLKKDVRHGNRLVRQRRSSLLKLVIKQSSRPLEVFLLH